MQELLRPRSLRHAAWTSITSPGTGGFFDASGNRFFVSVQHNVTGHGVILELTGWR